MDGENAVFMSFVRNKKIRFYLIQPQGCWLLKRIHTCYYLSRFRVRSNNKYSICLQAVTGCLVIVKNPVLAVDFFYLGYFERLPLLFFTVFLATRYSH